jgi:hydroxyacylglutathione hydrolase
VLTTPASEYTKGNIAFGAAILPERPAVKELLQFVRERKNGGVTTGAFTIGDEKKHNVFMLVRASQLGGPGPCSHT